MTSGAIARLIGPIWATNLYELKGEAPGTLFHAFVVKEIVFATTAFGLLVSLSIVIASYREMVKRIDVETT